VVCDDIGGAESIGARFQIPFKIYLKIIQTGIKLNAQGWASALVKKTMSSETLL
jgi:hypothetical protein